MKRKLLFILIPVLLIISASAVFYFVTIALGKYQGFLIGISFYWLYWCLIIPFIITKKPIAFYLKNIKPLFININWWVIILFLSTIIIPLFMYNTISNLLIKPLLLILLAIPLSIINGFCEELFWRGLYVKEFPNNILWGIIIPSLFFSLWHFAPQLAIPQRNKIIFVLSTLPLGITNGIVSYRTGSAKWSSIGHSVGGVFAFGGSTALSLFALLNQI